MAGALTPLSRRGLVVGAGACAALALTARRASAASPQTALAFEIWRNGRKIGRHTVSWDGGGAGVVATIAAELVVHIGPVPVFRYRHDAVETWRGDRFVSLRSHTTSNGKREQVSAEAAPSGVRITDGGGRVVTAAADAAPLTHWNRDALRRPLFNPQTGALTRVSVAQKAGERATLADGRTIPATRYTLTGDAQIVDWYDASDSWAALRGKAPDGSFIEYRRIA